MASASLDAPCRIAGFEIKCRGSARDRRHDDIPTDSDMLGIEVHDRARVAKQRERLVVVDLQSNLLEHAHGAVVNSVNPFFIQRLDPLVTVNRLDPRPLDDRRHRLANIPPTAALSAPTSGLGRHRTLL